MALLGCLLAALALLMPGPATPSPEAVHHSQTPPVVNEIVHQRDGALVRLILRLDAETGFDLFALGTPPRLVLDLPAVVWQAERPRDGAIPGIASLRFGLLHPGHSRLVIALARPMAVTRAYLGDTPGSAPYALVVEMQPTDAASFAASVRAPERRPPLLDRRPSQPGAASGLLVAVDPGHGGIDPGAVHEGLQEKDLVLDIARRLAARIEAAPGLSAFLTREDDRYISLRERLALVRRAGAHLMLSLHADSLAEGDVQGVGVYTLSDIASDRATRAFAERENRADILAGADLAGSDDALTRVLIDLARRSSRVESERLAQAVLGALDETVALLENSPHRRGDFFVLKAPDLPSVLIELGFLTNAADRARLTDPAWQEAVAGALVEGVRAWQEQASPGFLAPKAPAVE